MKILQYLVVCRIRNGTTAGQVAFRAEEILRHLTMENPKIEEDYPILQLWGT